MSLYDRITLGVFDGESSDLKACVRCEARKKLDNPMADCEHYRYCWRTYISGAVDMLNLLHSEAVVDGVSYGDNFATAKLTQSHMAFHGAYPLNDKEKTLLDEWKKLSV